MPELPEIEHLRRSLEPALLGAVIESVDIRRADVVRLVPVIGVEGTAEAAQATGHEGSKRRVSAPAPNTQPRGGEGRRAVGVLRGPSAARALINQLTGAEVMRLARHGKQLLIETSGGALIVHLGMSGRLTVERSAPEVSLPTPQPRGSRGRNHGQRDALAAGRGDAQPRKREPEEKAMAASSRDNAHLHVCMTIRRAGKRSMLHFRDPRRFGGLWLYTDRDQVEATRWSELGPDALSIGAADLTRALTGRKRAVKALLLDQVTIAGVGNIYADEALHRAGIHPGRAAASLDADEVRRLARALRQVLERAVAAGGSSFRDYVDATGRKGEYVRRHAVYGRGGQPCRTCATVLESAVIGGRTTVWCPRCQPAGKQRRRPPRRSASS